MERVGFARLLSTRRGPEAELVMAMVAGRVTTPQTKLATTAAEDQQAKATRDPVAAARRPEAADLKVATHRRADGTPAHSSRNLTHHGGACAVAHA